MAKLCHRPPSSGTSCVHAAPNHLDLPCWRGYSQQRNCLGCIMQIRSPTPPGGTHWRCHFMVRQIYLVTLRRRVHVEAPTSEQITADWGATWAARGWETLVLNVLSSWLWWENSTYQSAETPLRSRRPCRRLALTSRRRKPAPRWARLHQEHRHNLSSSTGHPGLSLHHKPVGRSRWIPWCEDSPWFPKLPCRARQRARSRTSGNHVQTVRKP